MDFRTFQFRDQNILVELGQNKMVNVTEVSNYYDRKPNHFLRNQQTKLFISTLECVANLQLTEIVQVVRGNHKDKRPQGTWMHELLAIEYAGWLEPKFKLWMIQTIRSLLVEGQKPKSKPVQKVAKQKQYIAFPHLLELHKSTTELFKEFNAYEYANGVMAGADLYSIGYEQVRWRNQVSKTPTEEMGKKLVRCLLNLQVANGQAKSDHVFQAMLKSGGKPIELIVG